jgi:hypothetical protein
MNAQVEGVEVEQEDLVELEQGAELGTEEGAVVENEEPAWTEEDAELASKMGWTDKDQFHGDPDKWVDPKEFLRRGNEHVGILKSRVTRGEQQISKLQEQNNKLIKLMSKKFIAEHERGEAQLKRVRQEAIDSGDGEAFTKADEALEAHRANKPEIEEVAETDEGKPQVSPEIAAMTEDFMARNKWFGSNQEMTDFAEFYGTKLNQQGIQGKQFFEQLESKVKQMFPEPGKPRKRQPVGGARAPTSGKTKITAASLTAEEKAAGEFLVRNNIVKNLDEYAVSLKSGN